MTLRPLPHRVSLLCANTFGGVSRAAWTRSPDFETHLGGIDVMNYRFRGSVSGM